jgi:hypothetical protein
LDAGSPGCKPVPKAESCRGRGVVRVEVCVDAVYPWGIFGVSGGIPAESDSSDPEEIGRVEDGPPSARLFISDKDSIGRILAIDGARDTGRGGRTLSRPHDLMTVLLDGISVTSGVAGPGKLWVDEVEGVLT